MVNEISRYEVLARESLHLYDAVLDKPFKDGKVTIIPVVLVEKYGKKHHLRLYVRDKRVVRYTCDCPSWAFRGICKHLYIVLLKIKSLTGELWEVALEGDPMTNRIHNLLDANQQSNIKNRAPEL